MVVKETGAKSVSVIAHSMGNQSTDLPGPPARMVAAPVTAGTARAPRHP